VSLFPALYDAVMIAGGERALAPMRRRLAARARGRVLEIGAGTGLNFAFYGPGARVAAIDPDVGMLRRASTRAARSPAAVDLVAASAEALPFRDGAFDHVVVALAMCTIPDPGAALAEIRRVARPGAAVRMLEHVRVEHPVARRAQAWLTPLWRHVAGGCRLDRDTVSEVRASGLAVESVRAHLGGLLVEITARARR
jgi:ubiquinone/menaquinone biosynthesis C-methylase UbiE